MNPVVLQAGITKKSPGVIALKDVGSICALAIHGLCGETAPVNRR
jgi:hypothetical protein